MNRFFLEFYLGIKHNRILRQLTTWHDAGMPQVLECNGGKIAHIFYAIEFDCEMTKRDVTSATQSVLFPCFHVVCIEKRGKEAFRFLCRFLWLVGHLEDLNGKPQRKRGNVVAEFMFFSEHLWEFRSFVCVYWSRPMEASTLTAFSLMAFHFLWKVRFPGGARETMSGENSEAITCEIIDCLVWWDTQTMAVD